MEKYKEYFAELENKLLREVMELTITKAFGDFINNCKNEKEAANVFISFQSLIEAKRNAECEINYENYGFYHFLFGVLQ